MFPTGFNPNMFAAGWAAPRPVAPGPVPALGGYYGAGPMEPMPQAGAANFGTYYADAERPERFVTSMSGGVIVGKDGAPAGRVPENSFVDLKDGSVYGPDGTKLDLPEGASVDLFDLPDLKQMSDDYNGAGNVTVADGGGAPGKPTPKVPTYPAYPAYPMYPQTAVDGQWGPGGITAFKGGAAPGKAGGCDHHGAMGGGAASPGMTVANPNTIASLQQQMSNGLNQLSRMGVNIPGGPSMVGGAYGGGPMHALGGYGHLGMQPGNLQHSLQELILTLRELVSTMQHAQGGGPAQVDQTAKTDSDTSTDTSTGSSNDSSTDDAADASTDTSTTGTGAKDEKSTDDDTSTSDDDSGSSSTSTSDTSTS